MKSNYTNARPSLDRLLFKAFSVLLCTIVLTSLFASCSTDEITPVSGRSIEEEMIFKKDSIATTSALDSIHGNTVQTSTTTEPINPPINPPTAPPAPKP